MNTTDAYWVYPNSDCLTYDLNTSEGKWMLFYPHNSLDSKWNELCYIFTQNKLKGICDMKCSTALKNERASNKNEGVIILYCGGTKEEVMMIGRGLLPYLSDYSRPDIYYKTNLQTRKGTAATGVSINYTYCLNVPQSYSFMDD